MDAVLEDGHICSEASYEEDIVMEKVRFLHPFFFFFFKTGLRFAKFFETVKVIQIDSKVLQLWTP